jgi:hypothetical protein
MDSADPVLVQDAVTVLTDIGGQQADLRAAEAALKAVQTGRATLYAELVEYLATVNALSVRDLCEMHSLYDREQRKVPIM